MNDTHPDIDEPTAASPPMELTTRPKRTLPLEVLHWIEGQHLTFELRRLKADRQTDEDTWWFACGDASPCCCGFREILHAVLDGASPAAVVHASRASEEPVPWRSIHYRAWWSEPLTAKIWTVAFWSACLLFGWFLVCLITPLGAQTVGQVAYLLTVLGIATARKPIAARLPNWAKSIRPRSPI